jgi:hypothetical protein
MKKLHETAEEFIARKSAEQHVTAYAESNEEGEAWTFHVEARTFLIEHATKVFVIERLSGGWLPDADVTYRIGYYRLMESGIWKRPQQNPVLSKRHLELLYAKAIVDGTLSI